MTEPDDPLERRLREGLHSDDAWLPDTATAQNRFAALRGGRLRKQRLLAVVAVGLGVAAVALVPAALGVYDDDGGQAVAPVASTEPSPQPTPSPAPVPDATATADPTQSLAPVPRLSATAEATLRPEPTPAKSAVPTPNATASAAEIVEVSEADSGRTIVLRRGDFLVVTLHGSAGFPWTVPASNDSNVLPRVGHTTANGGDTQVAKFVAERTGDATVSATQDPTCRDATPPCAAPSRAFEITVDIRA